jgi:hypothetical protein
MAGIFGRLFSSLLRFFSIFFVAINRSSSPSS